MCGCDLSDVSRPPRCEQHAEPILRSDLSWYGRMTGPRPPLLSAQRATYPLCWQPGTATPVPACHSRHALCVPSLIQTVARDCGHIAHA